MCAGIFVVGGRGDAYNKANSAEFLSFEPTKGGPKWVELPFLRKPHPNMPGASFIDGTLYVIGGGGIPFPGGENTVLSIPHLFYYTIVSLFLFFILPYE